MPNGLTHVCHAILLPAFVVDLVLLALSIHDALVDAPLIEMVGWAAIFALQLLLTFGWWFAYRVASRRWDIQHYSAYTGYLYSVIRSAGLMAVASALADERAAVLVAYTGLFFVRSPNLIEVFRVWVAETSGGVRFCGHDKDWALFTRLLAADHRWQYARQRPPAAVDER